MKLKNNIKRIIESDFFNLLLGIFILIFSVYDVIYEWNEISEGHFLVALGAIIILDSLKGLYEGAKKISKKNEDGSFKSFILKGDRLMNNPIIAFLIGILVIIANIATIFQEITEFKKEHALALIGVFITLIAVVNLTREIVETYKRSRIRV